MTSNIHKSYFISQFLRAAFIGVGQVMFQRSAIAGIIFLVGIIAGTVCNGTPIVAAGAVAGLLVSTLAGRFVAPRSDSDDGMWGFNGVLVGCALPTFMPCAWQMWFSLALYAALTVVVCRALNSALAPVGIGSLTFPFVFLTWIALLSGGACVAVSATQPMSGLDLSALSVVIYWLKGFSQVFLIDSPVTGLLFVIALALAHRSSALWAALGSALSLALAVMVGLDPLSISKGIYGFSPVLTAIAVGNAYGDYMPRFKKVFCVVVAIILTLAVQRAMEVLFAPVGMPVLTAPFCISAWIFLLARYRAK